MVTFLLSILLFMLAVVLMSLGVMLSGRRIKGSCGGLNTLPGIESDCGGTCHADPDGAENKCHRRSTSCNTRSRAARIKHAAADAKSAGSGARSQEPSWPNPRP